MTRATTTMPDRAEASTGLRWLADLRWAAFAGQLGTVLFVALVMKTPLDLAPSVGILALLLASNVVVAWLARRGHALAAPYVGAILAADVVLLTALLHFGGGPMNPFTFLYVVYVALASVVLPSPWPWMVAIAAAAGFGSLFAFGTGHAHHHHDIASMRLHLIGMWVAFCVGAVLLVAFVQRIRRELARRDEALAAAREARLRTERLASLATLAAGAAHELATPHGTIAIVASDLSRALAERGDAASANEVALVRREVARCKDVLDQMAADAGASSADAATDTKLGDLAERVVEPLGDRRARVHVRYDGCEASKTACVPPRALAQAIRAVLQNALQADTGMVDLTIARDGDDVRFVVTDRGAGMTPDVLARAKEPFFTTKREGEGMGLGLFLAHATIEPLGGALELASTEGAGTTATLVLPIARAANARAS
jgi:two-component system sensor histidine kinase RegB